MSRGNPEEARTSEEEARKAKMLATWSPSPLRQNRVHGPRTVNVLCLCGAIVGVASLFSVWFQITGPDYAFSWSITTCMVEHLGSSQLFIAEALFMLGAVTAFLTPASGVVQAAGLVVIASDTDLVCWGPGLYMGAISTTIVLASLFIPIGPGLESGVPHLRGRLLIWTKGDPKLEKPASTTNLSIRMSMKRFARVHARWLSLPVAALLWSVTVVSLDNDFFWDDDPLRQIPGGVAIESFALGHGLATFPWTWYRFTLSQAENSVGWNFSNPELASGTWCAVNLGPRDLGVLNVTLTALDRGGDPEGWGAFGPGDQLALVAQNGTSFEEGVIYSIWWKTDRSIAWAGVEFSFVIHHGNLDSWVSHVVEYGL